jgi:Y_Y_Y domain
MSVSPRAALPVKDLELAPNRNQLQIDFVGVDFRPGSALTYQYKLEGADTEWSAPVSERVVNYANIAPGTYRREPFLYRRLSEIAACEVARLGLGSGRQRVSEPLAGSLAPIPEEMGRLCQSQPDFPDRPLRPNQTG